MAKAKKRVLQALPRAEEESVLLDAVERSAVESAMQRRGAIQAELDRVVEGVLLRHNYAAADVARVRRYDPQNGAIVLALEKAPPPAAPEAKPT